MWKTWLVARQEYRRHVLRRSFVITLLLVPAVILAGAAIVGLRARPAAPPPPLALVDRAHARSSPRTVVTLGTEEEARAALREGRVAGFALLAEDPHAADAAVLVHAEAPGRRALEDLRRHVREHLLADRPPDVAARVVDGVHVVVRTPDGAREYTGSVTGGMVLPTIAGFFLLLLILVGSGDFMEAVAEERGGHTLELLATALPPARLVAGKILGIAAATLTLLLGWIAFALGAVLLARAASDGSWTDGLAPDPRALLLLVGLVVPAHVLVGSALAAAGTLLDEARSGRQLTAVLLSAFLGTTALALPIMEDPRSPLAVTLSLVPVLSTVLLPARDLFMQVPAGQVALAVALQVGGAALAAWLAGRAIRRALRPGATRRARRPAPVVRASDGPPPTSGARRARDRSRGAPVKVLLIARHEARTMLTKPLFVGLTLGLPVVLGLQLLAVSAASSRRSSARGRGGARPVAAAPARADGGTTAAGPDGYVDLAGLVRELPSGVSPGALRRFPSEAAAARALASGEIRGYSVIPREHLDTGRLVVVRPDASPLMRGEAAGQLPWVLLVNELGGDEELARRVRDPIRLEALPLDLPASSTEAGGALPSDRTFAFVGLLSMLLLYAVVLVASGTLLRSVSDEKKNRTMELLLVSVSPRALLGGKVLGLGVVGLIQAALWTGCLVGALAASGKLASLPPGLAGGPAAVAWGTLLFLFGYAVYAGLMASAGALVPNADEARGASFLLALPALLGFVAAQLSMGAPHGVFMTGLSLFPLTAPFVMMLRIAAGGVPAWQVLLSLALMGVTAVVVIRAAARVFRAQHLLSGQPFSFARYFAALRGADR